MDGLQARNRGRARPVAMQPALRGWRALPRAAFFLSLLCTVCGQEPECRLPCQCPPDPPLCAPGVPAVLDGCACCLVCARQRGESCSGRLPCQESRGLYCDRSAGTTADLGICMDLDGDNCVFDGMIYRTGETFQPSCKYHCTCRDGQIGCVPRCNLDLLLPGPECPFPRKIEIPTECCEQWACDTKEDVDLGDLAVPAYRPEATPGNSGFDSGTNCIEQTTEWSACSTTCGMGVSTRVTNKNPACEMVKQTRLCEVRPCENSLLPDKKGKKCIRTRKSLTAVRLEYKNCTSVQMYKPRYCGVCNDGRCCTPHSTKTIHVEFRCPHGGTIKHPVMSISTCVCHGSCSQNYNSFFRQLH
ncbi:CCN family member 3 isoform X1 [Sphaerodactylus townsendi]|uniref:CCN family member 3 isoform X1 n=1 Tax=Sphaerodactylus townsendi TaxID=933632 RepID=UPI002025F249|nr:CCN family member 3 isoform X1 [Sphaerodactylus townsendi]